MEIAIIGLGLIGGSLARALRQNTSHYIIGSDINEESLSAAIKSEVICKAVNNVPKADLYLLAMSPSATVDYLERFATEFSKGAIVTDVCGIKQSVTKKCEDICISNGLRFVGGHPMAGREVSGFKHSVSDLFVNRSYIITTTDKTDVDAVDTLKKLVLSLGVSNITITTPEHHDKMIAFTSQLPHILAGAYMKSPASRDHSGYSAGSYHDVSRVASVDEHLWSELFVENKTFLAEELKGLINSLENYLKAVEAGDKEELFRLVRESRLLKENDRKQNGVEQPHKFG